MIDKALDLWRWWLGEMLTLLPERWRSETAQFQALWRGDALTLMQQRGATLVAAESLPPETKVTLRIDDARVWQRQLTMPRAAAPYLRTILENELDRRTPWRADQVYFHAEARPHPQQRANLAVTLTCLPRQQAESALRALADRGWSADRILLADGATVMLQGGAERGASRLRWPQVMLGGLMGLALLSLIGQALLATWLEAQSVMARQQAATTRTLAGDVAALGRRQHLPSLRRQEMPANIAILDRLAQALPDDSWAEEIEINGATVTIGGISAEPARLLAALQSQGFSGAEFRAPITKAENGQKFLIRAQFGEAANAAR